MPALFRLWLPTVFGASMLVVEIPVVAAAAARSADGGRALAAIGVGMSILVVVNTPALAVTPLLVAERARRSARMLGAHTAAVGLLGTVVVLAAAVPPADAVVGAVFGLDAATGDAVSAFLIGLAPNSLGVAIRRFQHGRLIHDRRTGPIVWATVVRLASTAAIAWAGGRRVTAARRVHRRGGTVRRRVPRGVHVAGRPQPGVRTAGRAGHLVAGTGRPPWAPVRRPAARHGPPR